VPVGLYWIATAEPGKGEVAVIRLPNALRTLAAARGYLAATALLIKPVAAIMGDLVCRHGATVTINGQAAAHASTADGLGRPLPHWTGCITLTAGKVFLLSTAPDSFDSRYFGPIDSARVLGAAHPIWPRQHGGSGAPRQRGPPEAILPASWLLEAFKRAIHLRQRGGELRPERCEIAHRVVFCSQVLGVEGRGHQRGQRLLVQLAGSTRRFQHLVAQALAVEYQAAIEPQP
jgi:conjugative transfer signal peptidase TraF